MKDQLIQLFTALMAKIPQEIDPPIPSEKWEQYLGDVLSLVINTDIDEPGGGLLVVTATNGTLDKTWDEIVTAMSTTGAVLVHYSDGSIDNLKMFQTASTDGESYYEVKTGSGALNTYEASSASGYPVQQS
jgi:hypothetical protein